ncbi:MAG TPA: hypothetical protein VGO57_15750 [Verrucomicrobiae bacterium]
MKYANKTLSGKTKVFQRVLFFVLLTTSLNAPAADKWSVRINNQPISMYRTVDLADAVKEAVAAHKPIVWIASAPKLIDGNGTISANSPRGATLHALYALRNKAVLVFEDAYTENHKVIGFIDTALHTPNPHYLPPTVLFLDANATNVIATVIYEPDFMKRAQNLAKALDDIKGKY